MQVRAAIGTYIDLFTDNGDLNIIIILNESNGIPTYEEVDAITEALKPLFERKYKSISAVKGRVTSIMDNLELKCLKFGYQRIVKMR